MFLTALTGVCGLDVLNDANLQPAAVAKRGGSYKPPPGRCKPKPKTKPTKPKTKPTKPKTKPTKPKTKPTKPDCYRQLGQEINGKAKYGRRGWSVYLKMGEYRLAVGGYRMNACQIRMYEYDGSDWNQLGQRMYGAAARGAVGWTVALNDAGDRLTICAYFENGRTLVRVYKYDGSSWSQYGRDMYGEPEGNESDLIASWSMDGDQLSIDNDTLGPISDDICFYDYEASYWKDICPCEKGKPNRDYSD